jgi:radical SAM modification target selenobiotic family peptide
MDSKELKKILAGVGIASLVAGASLAAPSCATAGTSG